MTWRENNRTLQIRKGGLWSPSSDRASEQHQSPLIIQVFPSSRKQTPSLVFAAAAAARNASVPIAVHLDHAQGYEHVKELAENLPFDSTMVDMSHYEKEDDLEKTRTLREYCHEREISVYAWTGRIEGGEDGIMDTGDLGAILTNPEDAEEFIAVGVDFLAPSVGNIHGDYGPKGPNLDMDRLTRIFKVLNSRVRLVLHGTNDFTPEWTQACIRAGVTKVNVNKIILDPWHVHLRANVDRPLTELMEEGIQLLAKEMGRWMDIVGSSGKA